MGLMLLCNFIFAQQTIQTASGIYDPSNIEELTGSRQTPCLSEKGFNDFPFTENGITVTSAGTGFYVLYFQIETWCGVSTKLDAVWIGLNQASTFTNTFSSPVNDLVYNLSAINNDEVITITTDGGAPSISILETTCPSEFNITGNVITKNIGEIAGVTIQVHAPSSFTTMTISHNGAGNGTTITLCSDNLSSSVNVVPISNWAMFLALGLIISFIIIRFRRVF